LQLNERQPEPWRTRYRELIEARRDGRMSQEALEAELAWVRAENLVSFPPATRPFPNNERARLYAAGRAAIARGEARGLSAAARAQLRSDLSGRDVYLFWYMPVAEDLRRVRELLGFMRGAGSGREGAGELAADIEYVGWMLVREYRRDLWSGKIPWLPTMGGGTRKETEVDALARECGEGAGRGGN